MTIWEKAIINIEKGTKKITVGAALFSERVRAEIAVARLRIQLNEVRMLIREQERAIGHTIVTLKKKNELPTSIEQLLNEDDVVTALAEIAIREKDLEDIINEIANEQSAVKATEKAKEETSL